ncbi:MAG: IS1595 family transposase [Rhodospirillales bacterium]|nr:IS1595 family transposase [Rhodospirillales bacterium]
MADKFTVRDFFNRFPDDDSCLHHVMEVRFGARHVCQSCDQEATFHKLANRKAYACSRCGDNLYPCAGTIFQDSRTSLQLWFYAIYLFVITRHGVSGKELQRTLGVTYKTAWRIAKQIRTLMGEVDGFEKLRGHVEIDEAYIGGYIKGGQGGRGKTIAVGVKERGGRMIAGVAEDTTTNTLRGIVHQTIEPGSTVSTDELPAYNLLTSDGYQHGTVKHGAKQYVRYDDTTDALHHVNNVETFWGLFKKSIASTHIHVSPKYMGLYLREFTFRSNHREKQNAMFDLLIGAV